MQNVEAAQMSPLFYETYFFSLLFNFVPFVPFCGQSNCRIIGAGPETEDE
jgi:hypothetical protein